MNDLSRRDVALLAVYAALLVLGLAWIVRAIGGGADGAEPIASTASEQAVGEEAASGAPASDEAASVEIATVEPASVETASEETAHAQEASIEATIVDAVSVEEASAPTPALDLEPPAIPTDDDAAGSVAAARTLVVRVVARDGAPAPARERVRVLAIRECPDAALEATRARANVVVAEPAPDDTPAGPPALAFTLSELDREPLHVAAYVDERLAGVELVGAGEQELVLALGEAAAPSAPEREDRVELSAAPRGVVRGELRRASDGPRVFPVLLEPLASVEASGSDASGDVSAGAAPSTPLAPAAILERAREARLEYSREDGTFQFAPVEPGRYRLRVPSPDEGIPWPSDDELASRPLAIEVGGEGEGARAHVLVLEPARRVHVEATIDRGALLWWELRDEGGAVLRVAQVVEGRVPDLLLPGGRYEIVMVGVEGERARRGFVVESVGVGGDAGVGEGEGVVVVELGDVR